MEIDQAKLREAFGLNADASEEEVRTAMVAAGFQAAPAPSPDQPPSGDHGQLAAKGNSLTVAMEASKFDEMQQRIEQLEAFRKKAQTEERDKAIDAAIADGRISVSNRPSWVANWDANPKGTEELLSQLVPNRIPVAEMGYGVDLNDDDLLDGMPVEFRGMWPQGAGKGF